GILYQRLQIPARAIFTRGELEDTVVKTSLDQIIFQRALVFQVLLGLAAVHLVERRLRDIEITAFDQRRHLAEEERQQQRADMRTVDVGVGHQNDLVIAQ